jgi:hypothetical protein
MRYAWCSPTLCIHKESAEPFGAGPVEDRAVANRRRNTALKITLAALVSVSFLLGHGPTPASNLLDDAKIIISELDAAGALNPTDHKAVQDTRSGLSQLISSNMATISSGDVSAFNQSMLLGDLRSAVKHLQTNEPTNRTVQVASDVALDTLRTLDNQISASAQIQAEAAVGAVLIDFLTAKRPTGTRTDANSSISAAIADAHRQINVLRGVAS